MNPVTFNDDFKLCFEKFKVARSALESPLICWGEDKSTEVTLDEMNEATGGDGEYIRLPFPAFRVFGNLGDSGVLQGEIKSAKTVIFSGENSEVHAFMTAKGSDLLTWFSFKPAFLDGGKIREPNADMLRVLFFTASTGEEINPHEAKDRFPDGDLGKHLSLFAQRMLVSILKLVRDFQNPHFHLCRITPPIPMGKTILWQKQREHYVLLHKNHPANKPDSHGKIINSEPQVLRIAHSRRAHFRILRSPKFKNKVGQKIWIKSAWIGPKEWTDRSGQIYKIVEPNISNN